MLVKEYVNVMVIDGVNDAVGVIVCVKVFVSVWVTVAVTEGVSVCVGVPASLMSCKSTVCVTAAIFSSLPCSTLA